MSLAWISLTVSLSLSVFKAMSLARSLLLSLPVEGRCLSLNPCLWDVIQQTALKDLLRGSYGDLPTKGCVHGDDDNGHVFLIT